MNKQVCECFRILMERNRNSVTIDELASQLDVSVRTIRNYAAEIDSFLAGHQLDSFYYYNNSVLRFAAGEQELEEAARIITELDFYTYRLNFEERQDILALTLLFADAPVTLKVLENLLYIGRSTLIGDVSMLSVQFETYSISFSENKQKGFTISCPESVRRSTIFSIFKKMCRPYPLPWNNLLCDTCIGYAGRLLKFGKSLHQAERAIRAAEQYFDVSMTDYDFYDLAVMFCISMQRIKSSHLIEADFTFDQATYAFPCNMMDYAFKQLYNEAIPEPETMYITDKLVRRHPVFLEPLKTDEHLNISIIIKSLLYRLSNIYGIDLFGDSVLQTYLTSHVLRIYHRIQDGHVLQNPFKEELMAEYPKDYQILCDNIEILEKGLNCRFNEDAITDVLAHILAVLERMYSRLRIPNVIIACDTGLGTANFLASKVKKNFDINIVSITSSHNIADSLIKHSCDLILSTVPLKGLQNRWLQVTPSLSQKDRREIREILFDIRKEIQEVDRGTKDSESSEKAVAILENIVLESNHSVSKRTEQEPENLLFSDLLTEGHILLIERETDWKQAILTAGKPMLDDRKVTSDYLDAMVENVLENGPYIVFVPGVAIAHASAKAGVLDVSAALLRLNEPVAFGHEANDPVYFVIALSIEKSMWHMNTFLDALTIFCNCEALCELSRAGDEAEILAIIRRYESLK